MEPHGLEGFEDEIDSVHDSENEGETYQDVLNIECFVLAYRARESQQHGQHLQT